MRARNTQANHALHTYHLYTIVSPLIDARACFCQVLNSEGSTMESDVYSFGVVVWEVVTTELPWANKKPLEIYCAVLGGRRPDFPLDTPAFIADVARRCWAGKADERPTFRAIMKDLR